MPILDSNAAKALGHALLQCGGRLTSRPEVRDDPEALGEIARVLATGLQRLEGALGQVVLAPPAGLPFVPAEAAGEVYPGLIDGEVA